MTFEANSEDLVCFPLVGLDLLIFMGDPLFLSPYPFLFGYFLPIAPWLA